MQEELELPPAGFTNKINSLRHDSLLRDDFDFRYWRKSPEWKIYVAGYNDCVEKCNSKILSQYNMGETTDRIFGGERK